MNKVTNGDGTN